GRYEPGEVVRDANGGPRIDGKGSFVFALAGRDREKTASYYTPEVLTECLTRYTLKERLGPGIMAEYEARRPLPPELPADEMLQLTTLEPAMGSGAFLGEAIDQLADAYLHKKQDETGQTLPADQYVAAR